MGEIWGNGEAPSSGSRTPVTTDAFAEAVENTFLTPRAIAAEDGPRSIAPELSRRSGGNKAWRGRLALCPDTQAPRAYSLARLPMPPSLASKSVTPMTRGSFLALE